MQISQPLADEFNRAASFLPQVDDDTKPCIVIGGAQVYAYVEPGVGIVVSLHVDTGEIPAALLSPQETVPVRITVNGSDVYSAA
ncbi:hypothetical protein [Streptomyces sp. 11x1]|uniref:hypothetical protein n=1 Tax=Streptomyces sp. 11x1 TaxID=3038642 RepID=UPI00293158BD|nr:hypothetical protein [Streptomyces sp. 11x1]WNZ14891.1 hypothetical protein P8T65_46495 [Streptomyces sp. 11x1]